MANVKNCNGGGTLSSTLVNSGIDTQSRANSLVSRRESKPSETSSLAPRGRGGQDERCRLTRRAVSTQKRGGNLNHV